MASLREAVEFCAWLWRRSTNRSCARVSTEQCQYGESAHAPEEFQLSRHNWPAFESCSCIHREPGGPGDSENLEIWLVRRSSGVDRLCGASLGETAAPELVVSLH